MTLISVLIAMAFLTFYILYKRGNIHPWVAVAYIVLSVIATIMLTLEFIRQLGG